MPIALLSADEMCCELVNALGEGFLEDLIRLMFSAYRSADEYCVQNFPRDQAADLRPMVRRAMIERDVKPLAESHDLKANVVRTVKGKAFHTEIRRKNVVLTISAVDTPQSMFRDAAFRKNLASAQMDLFDPNSSSADLPLYAVLLHGPTRNQSAPRFGVIAFPGADCKNYIAKLALFCKFPVVIEQLTTKATPERIAEPKPGKLKKKVTKKTPTS